jgi:hypothetical protein
MLLSSILILPSGCGGGSRSVSPAIPGGVTAPAAGRGQVRFTIRWPETTPTRLIPLSAKSIKFRCLDADDEDEVILEVVVPQGQSMVTLDLPSVRVRIEAEAHANQDGTGQVLAKGGVTVLVKEARVTAEKLSLGSVISQVKLSQSQADIAYDQSVEVSADALDADGAVLLTAPESWEWTPDDVSAAAAAVEYAPSGGRLSVRAKKDGAVAFTVREKETGKTARLNVTSHGQTEQPPSDPPYEFGLNIPSEVHVAAGDIAEIVAVYKHPDGRLENVPLMFTEPHGAQLVGEFNGRIRIRGTTPTKSAGVTADAGISVNAGGGWQTVRIITKGRLLVGSIYGREPGADVRCAVYLDDSLVASFTDKPNEMGEPDRVNMFKLNAAPGLHKLRIVNLSPVSATITAKITNPFRSIGYQDMGLSANASDSQWIRIPEEE